MTVGLVERLIDKAPPCNVTCEAWWPWVTDLALPALGIAASAFVGIVAIWLARRDRTKEVSALNRKARYHFETQVIDYVLRWPANLVQQPTRDQLIAEAEQLDPPVPEIASWATTAAERIIRTVKNRFTPDMSGEGHVLKRDAFKALYRTAKTRLRSWARTGKGFDTSPFEFPGIDDD